MNLRWALSEMLEQDATAAGGARHERGERRRTPLGADQRQDRLSRWQGRDRAPTGWTGAERVPPSWENAVSEDLLGKWAMNQMLINVSTRRFKRSVRLHEGDVPASDGAGLSKSATSRRFVALSGARMKAWMAVTQIYARFSASLGNGRRRKGRNAHSQSRPPSRTGLERRFRFDPWKGSLDGPAMGRRRRKEPKASVD